jgi:hypothetical protein
MSDAEIIVGDTVHYVSYGTPGGEYSSKCRAATVAEIGAWVTVGEDAPAPTTPTSPRRRLLEQVWSGDAVELVVLNPTGLFFKTIQYRGIDLGPPVAGTWHHVHECRAR